MSNTTMRFPKPGEFHLKDDPMITMRKCLKVHGSDGVKKYFCISSLILKTFCLIPRIVHVIQCLNNPRRIVDLTASFPITLMSWILHQIPLPVVSSVLIFYAALPSYLEKCKIVGWDKAMLKMVYLYIEKTRVDYLYDTVKYEFWDYRIAGHEIEKQAISKFAFTNRIFVLHTGATLTCVLLFMAYPVADMPSKGDKILPIVIWAPFDINPSPVYEILFFILFLNAALTAAGNLVYDFFYVYCVQHLYVQFMVLKGLLVNITDGIMVDHSDVERFNSEYFRKTLMDRLKICAEHHSRLLQYGKNIEIYCSKVLVPQLVMTYISLVVNGFVLSVDRSNISKSTTMFNLSVSTLVQIFLFAVLSSELHQQSLSVIDAIYDSKWYLFDASAKKVCTFIVMNARRGIVIKAGGSTKIDNTLMATMLQKVFSAVTLIKALVDGNTTN